MHGGLGRLQSVDQRDRNFLIRTYAEPLKEARKPHLLWLDHMWWGDQGSTSQCVEYSWHHWVDAYPVRPTTMKKLGIISVNLKKAPYWELGSVYHSAQKDDEWPGEDYDGTSVRAGAKVLQSLGFINNYLWAWNIEEMRDAVRYVGPVVVGTNWYTDMFSPDSTGLVKVRGWVEGGHAYLISGYNPRTGLFRAKNSWSRDWGRNGRFSISEDDMARLLEEDGEACLAVENML